MDLDGKNYYEILEVPIGATPEEVHQGYVRSKNAYSGNSLALYSLMTQDECNSILEIVEEAYSILGDPKKRSEYDRIRGFNTPTVEQKVATTQSNNSDFKLSEETLDELSQKLNHTEPQESFNIRRREAEVSKIAAKNRFSVDYEVNSEFEQEIENATEFTGEFLQKIREYKGVSIERLADMTKISKTYLRNIEAESTENLPALVYVRGFVYQYAKMLKLNPDIVATSFIHRLKSKA